MVGDASRTRAGVIVGVAVGYASAILLLAAGCSFTLPSAGGDNDGSLGDAARDAHRVIDAAIDAKPDALGPPQAHLVQTLHFGATFTTTETLTVSETQGDLMVVAVYNTSPDATFAVTDTAGLTWTPETPVAASGCMPALQLWHAPVGATAVNAITVTTAANNYLGMMVAEYSGVSAVSGAATVAAEANSSTAAMTITTTDQAMVYAVFADDNGLGNPGPPSGWNERDSDGFFYSVAEDNGVGAAAGTQSPSASPLAHNDNCWVGAAIALRTP